MNDRTPKIVARVTGGLGNQLFCYSAARRLALINEMELVIDDVSGFENDARYQRRYELDRFSIPCRKATATERLVPFSRIRRYCKRRFNSRRPFHTRSYIQQEGVAFDRRLLEVRPSQTVFIEGYWQSENYFVDVEQTIRADLRIPPPNDAINRQIASEMSGGISVAVHLRFFDPPGRPGIHNVSVDYYRNAIASVEAQLGDRPRYFVFSDRPDVAEAGAGAVFPRHRTTWLSHNSGPSAACADLWLMTRCKHFIIANSTFSWWGAWLAEYSMKQVIAPGSNLLTGPRITSWGFEGQLPATWIRI